MVFRSSISFFLLFLLMLMISIFLWTFLWIITLSHLINFTRSSISVGGSLSISSKRTTSSRINFINIHRGLFDINRWFFGHLVTGSFLYRVWYIDILIYRPTSLAFPVNESRRSIDCDKCDLPPSRRQPSYGSMIFREKDENYEIAVSSFCQVSLSNLIVSRVVYTKRHVDGWMDRSFSAIVEFACCGDKASCIPLFYHKSSRRWKNVQIILCWQILTTNTNKHSNEFTSWRKQGIKFTKKRKL